MRRLVLWVLVGGVVSCWSNRAAAQAAPAQAAPARDADPALVAPPTPPAAVAQRFEVYDKNRNLRIALLATGIPLFTLSYALPCAGARGVWCAPFVGPFLKIKQIADREAQQDPDEDGIIPPVFVYSVLVELAAVQIASASLVMAGALLPRREGKRVVSSVALVPSLSPSALGLSAVGTF